MKEQLLNLIAQLRVKHCQMQKNLFDPSPEYPEILAKISAKIDELEQEINTEGYAAASTVTDKIYTLWIWLWDHKYAFIKRSCLSEFDSVLGEIQLEL